MKLLSKFALSAHNGTLIHKNGRCLLRTQSAINFFQDQLLSELETEFFVKFDCCFGVDSQKTSDLKLEQIKNIINRVLLMKKVMTIFGAILFASFILHGCARFNTSSINRPIERHSSNWEVLGSVRLEILKGSNVTENSASMPYDILLKMAHDKYGEMADVIEIKKENQTLSIVEKMTLFKETKKSYSSRIVYNALVIKYLPVVNSVK